MISDKIEAIKAAVNEQLAKSEHLQDVQDIRVKFLGKKGELTAIMKEMKNFSKEERPKVGQLVNTARNAIEEQLKAKMEEVKAKELAAKTGKTLTSVIEESLRETFARRRLAAERTRVVLPVENGDGLFPGVDLDDSAALIDLLEGR